MLIKKLEDFKLSNKAMLPASCFLLPVFRFSLILLVLPVLLILLLGCGNAWIKVTERSYLPDVGEEFTIAGENKYGEVLYAFSLEPLVTIKTLSFGVLDAGPFGQYGVLKIIDILSDQAYKIYHDRYLVPKEDCPASFFHQNFQVLVLIPVNNLIAERLESYDIPFDARGTPFELRGHYMHHISNRYTENGKKINLHIPKYQNSSSNVGHANTPIHYFLVTDL